MDPALGLVYLPTGKASPGYQGGARRAFDDAFPSSVIALDADTGALRWRFQTLHHDWWDYDAPAQRTLVNLPTTQGIRHALIEPTKCGEIFVLDRATGDPIKAVQELLVPKVASLLPPHLLPGDDF